MTKLKVGDRVETTVGAFPFQGRTGVVRKIRLFRLVDVWCDEPDLLGRHLIHVTRSGVRKVEPDDLVA
jgi:hypothetical protein